MLVTDSIRGNLNEMLPPDILSLLQKLSLEAKLWARQDRAAWSNTMSC